MNFLAANHSNEGCFYDFQNADTPTISYRYFLTLARWLFLLCLVPLAQANTLTIPAQFTAINFTAINASVSGDTVLIADKSTHSHRSACLSASF